MPNEPIDFILVRDRATGAKKYVPLAKYEAQKDLWAQVGGGKTVRAYQAPTYQASAPTSGNEKSGQQAATEKE